MVVVDLPFPPSTNDIWRMGKRRVMHIGPEYNKFKKQADALLMINGVKPLQLTTRGPFTLQIRLDEHRFGTFDLDNTLKALIDYLQRVEFIENDKWNRMMVVEWGKTINGCRVTIRPWTNRNDFFRSIFENDALAGSEAA